MSSKHYQEIVKRARSPKHRVSNPEPICQKCATAKGKLLRCSRCLVVFYCSKEHQISDFREHKEDCAFIKKAREASAKYELVLRKSANDPFKQLEKGYANIFWKTEDGRRYMESLFQYVQRLQ